MGVHLRLIKIKKSKFKQNSDCFLRCAYSSNKSSIRYHKHKMKTSILPSKELSSQQNLLLLMFITSENIKTGDAMKKKTKKLVLKSFVCI